MSKIKVLVWVLRSETERLDLYLELSADRSVLSDSGPFHRLVEPALKAVGSNPTSTVSPVLEVWPSGLRQLS